MAFYAVLWMQTQTWCFVNKLYIDLVPVLHGELDKTVFIKIDLDSQPLKELIDQPMG